MFRNRFPSVRHGTWRAFAFAAVVVFSSQTLTAAPQEDADSAVRIVYQVRPVPRDDRTDLEIEVAWNTGSAEATEIRLIADNYGVQDLHRYITSIKGVRGTHAERSEDGSTCVVTPNDDGQATLAYTISYDPVELDGYAFGPIVTANNFHVAGCQWMLRIQPNDEIHELEINVVDVPEGWNLYSTLAADPRQAMEVEANFDNLISSTLGGGSQTRKVYDINGNPLSVFVQEGFELPAEEIADAAAKIVRIQRDWFNDHDQPFYNITVLKRSSILAGTSVPNMFVCFVGERSDPDGLLALFSHEMFHYWLPNKCEIDLPPGVRGFKHEWFSEGFTEYFSRRILLEAGLISQREFVEQFNRDLRDLVDNPSRLDTFADLVRRAEQGQFSSPQKKLAYARGAVIALNWETQLRNAGHERGLRGFISDFVAFAQEQGGEVSEQQFLDFGANYGLDVAGVVQANIVHGEEIRVRPGAFGEEFPLRDTTMPLFEPGFDVQASRAANKVTGVIEEGPAYVAGLRNGMEIVTIRNTARFSNAWYPDRPIEVTVLLDGQEREIQFLPHGERVPVQLFELPEAAGNAEKIRQKNGRRP